MPTEAAVRRWVAEDREGFAALYWRSRQCGCDMLADQMLTIADGRHDDWIEYRSENGETRWALDDKRTARRRLAVKTRQWLLSRMLRASRWDQRHSTQGAGGPALRPASVASAGFAGRHPARRSGRIPRPARRPDGRRTRVPRNMRRQRQ
jgi:hypothetical protein